MRTPDNPNTTPSAMLQAIGEALYGQEWMRPLAAALDTHETQIRRWMERPGRLDREHELFTRALVLLHSRATEIWRLRSELLRWRGDA